MKNPFRANEPVTNLEPEIDAILAEMHNQGVLSPEYPKLMAQLEKLNKLKADNRPSRVNPDTVALIAGNLAGILLIVAYEQKHVITTKSFTQLIRPDRTN